MFYSLNKELILCVSSFLLLQLPPRLSLSLLAVKPLTRSKAPTKQWLQTLKPSRKTQPLLAKKLLTRPLKLLKALLKLLKKLLKTLLLKLKLRSKLSNPRFAIAALRQ